MEKKLTNSWWIQTDWAGWDLVTKKPLPVKEKWKTEHMNSTTSLPLARLYPIQPIDLDQLNVQNSLHCTLPQIGNCLTMY